MLSGGGTLANTNVAAELLRLLGSLERLRSTDKGLMVDACMQALSKKRMAPLRPALLWTIGRLGCRVPVYASLQQTVAPDRVVPWIDALLGMNVASLEKDQGAYGLALMLLARRTGDRYRDIPDSVRGRVLETLQRMGAHAIHRELVERGGRLDEEHASQVVGDSLPLGFTLRG